MTDRRLEYNDLVRFEDGRIGAIYEVRWELGADPKPTGPQYVVRLLGGEMATAFASDLTYLGAVGAE